jgi:enoyl-CoA hydratase/carnithine racemase
MFDKMGTVLANFPLPTLCVMNGSAYGAGVDLAFSCDLRIGVQGSRLAVPAARLGLCYPLNGVQRFVSRLGVGLAKRLLVGGETIRAEELYRLGMLDYLVERPELPTKQTELVQRIIALAPLATQGMKRLINQFAVHQWDDVEAQAIYQQCLDSQDLQEGFTAHTEKRTPIFKGN